MGFMTRLRSIGQFLAVVEVPLRVRVRDRRTSIVYWIAQSLVLLYGGIYMFGKQRGYQASGDIAFSSEFRFTGSVSISKPTGVQFLDSSEIVRLYSDGFFIATNYAEAVQDRDKRCPSLTRTCDPRLPTTENGCPADQFTGNGLVTGVCLANATNDGGSCEIHGWCPLAPPLISPAHQVTNWGNVTWWWRTNIKMLSSVDSNNKLRTWSQELGPFTLAQQITGQTLEDNALAAEVNAALGPGQQGADVALSITFFCDLDNPIVENCGLRMMTVETDTAPFTAFRLDSANTRTSGAILTETDMIYPHTRVLRNMTGLRLRLAITGESREADLYTTIFNLGTLLWVAFLSQFVAETVLLRFSPSRAFYEEVIYRDINELHLPAPAGQGPPGTFAYLRKSLTASLSDLKSFAVMGGTAGVTPVRSAQLAAESSLDTADGAPCAEGERLAVAPDKSERSRQLSSDHGHRGTGTSGAGADVGSWERSRRQLWAKGIAEGGGDDPQSSSSPSGSVSGGSGGRSGSSGDADGPCPHASQNAPIDQDGARVISASRLIFGSAPATATAVAAAAQSAAVGEREGAVAGETFRPSREAAAEAARVLLEEG